MEPIKVLDHGLVRLVSYMQPVFNDPRWVAPPSDWTGDLEIVRNARVSYDADWRTGADEGKDAKLLDYMYSNRHTSPFEAMVFTFEVKAPLFVLRQWHRHRMWSYNEVSARYAELPEEFYVPNWEDVGVQSSHNKQVRNFLISEDITHEQKMQAESVVQAMQAHSVKAFALYKTMLADGVPRELARTVLPLSTYSRMFATVDLHNLFHFIRLRDHSHAQHEIRVYAQALLQLIEPVVPIAVAAFKKSQGVDNG
jgi:thymidylate synthase (FAD)